MSSPGILRRLLSPGGTYLLLSLFLASCGGQPTTPGPPASESDASAKGVTHSNSAFPTWHQGFNHGISGWYGAETPEELGWCGTIEQVSRHESSMEPSAGRGFATLASGPCNEFWSSLGLPSGAPYGPGPEQSLYSSAWPRGGYVAALDIYLDPAWSSDYVGTLAPGTLIEYGTTIFPLEPEPGPFHTAPHFFVGVAAEDDALAVLGHRIIEAGWYTFQFVFDDAGGHIQVAFELRDRRGGLLVEDVIEPVRLMGPVKVPFEDPLLASQWGSGHVWFFDIAAGLQLPVDEYRVRQGR